MPTRARRVSKKRAFPTRAELTRFEGRFTRAGLNALADLSRDQLERLALQFASTAYVIQEDGRPVIFDPLPRFVAAAGLPRGMRLVQVASLGPTRRELGVPIDEGETAFILETHSSEEGSYVFALVGPANRLRRPRVDEDEQDRIAARLAEIIWDGVIGEQSRQPHRVGP